MSMDVDEDMRELARTSIKPVVPILGLGAGMLPFMVSFQTTSTASVTTTHGADISTRTSKNGVDYVAVGGGGLAVAIGLYALIKGLRVRNFPVLGLGIAAAALGLFQLLRGTILLGV